MVPNAFFFAINRREVEPRKGLEHSVVKEIQRIWREEKEMKLRRYRITIVINLYIIPRSVFFVLSSISFVFED